LFSVETIRTLALRQLMR